MSPELRAAINRANSQHSTGPRTPVGRQKSSLNAIRHGLTSQVVVLPTEDPEIYQRHLKSFTDEYQPQGATEANLVQSLADTAWRLNRITTIETTVLSQSIVDHHMTGPAVASALESQAKALANLSLHSQRLSRQFEKTVAQLRELQQLRRTEEKQALDKVLDIMEIYKSKGETYHPSEDGFVFSEAQINQATRTRQRAKASAAQ